MTTVIMKQTEDDVIIGWDAQASAGNERSSLVQPKAFERDGLVFGVAGTTLAMAMLKVMCIPEYDGEDPYSWLCGVFTPVLGEASAKAGLITKQGGTKYSLLAVVNGDVFSFDGSLSPSSTESGIHSVGSGSYFALGALHAGVTVMEALSVAATLDIHTGGTLTVTTASELVKGSK